MEEAIDNATSQKVAVVTGANKGIGLEICRQLSARGVTVVLTSRDEERGLAAVRKLEASGAADVVFHQLDVNESASVASLGDFIHTRFGKLDILVNNAAIGGVALNTQVLDSSKQAPVSSSGLANAIVETYELAEECINTNFYGPKRVTEALIPLLQSSQSPRIVNVSSLYGKLQYIRSERIKEELRNVDTLSEDRLDRLLQAFLNDFKEGKLDQNVWPTRNMMAYKVTKVALSAYTRILAKRHPRFCINCVNPGFVKTDLNWNLGVLPVEVGAEGPVHLAMLPDGSPSGLFYDLKEVSSFE
ncbi:(+)-neomenthol dehydrogenase-like isoform X2 [Curcuma longa]|uniref:(+)-neomenthol dehydrogenase-like isoform X2 n=1 Tax=Curcuma longa TaxID=136217 RepID=UPI003D9EF42C